MRYRHLSFSLAIALLASAAIANPFPEQSLQPSDIPADWPPMIESSTPQPPVAPPVPYSGAYNPAPIAPSPQASPYPQPAPPPAAFAPPPAAYAPSPTQPAMRAHIDESYGRSFPQTRETDFDRPLTFGDVMQFSFGAGLGYMPKFESAKNYRVLPLPIVDIRYRDTFFFNTFRGLGYNLFNTEDLKAGPILSVNWGRDSDDARYLHGFKDIDPTLESGFFFEKNLMQNIRVIWDLRNDLLNRGYQGFTSNAAVEGRIPVNEQVELSVSPNIGWASDGYMESFFGVNRFQSARSGLPAYKASAGFKDVGVDIGARYAMSEHLAIAVALGMKHLIGDAADSPITEHGSDNQFTGGSYFVYTF